MHRLFPSCFIFSFLAFAAVLPRAIAESKFKAAGSDLTSADPASERVILEIDEPDWNHNSGRLAFGPDGFLYLSVGDGGAFNDVGDVARGRGHPPEGNGQKLDTLLGKVLRLDVDHGTPYGIPRDNPFADGKKGLPEIFAYVLANGMNSAFGTRGKVFKLVPQ